LKPSKSRREAYYALAQEVADSARLTEDRATKILDDAFKKGNGSLQLGALSRILSADALLANLMPTAEDLSWWEQLDELEEALAENRLADRVLPSGRRVPFESARLDE
jgi:hypothetical protein